MPAPRKTALHGRCISGGVRCHSPSSAGKAGDSVKSETPCGDRGFGVDRRHLAIDGKMEAAGIEPASPAESTVNRDCGSVKCHHPCAARALHSGRLNCPYLASLDADLQRVIAAWDGLPDAIRKAVLALIGSQQADPRW